jgi:DNA-3-methyladenine glycosylase II
MTPTQYLVKADAQLERIIAQVPLPEVACTHDVFHDLKSCILEQQIHYRSTKRIFQKMIDLAGLERLTLENFEVFEQKALPSAKLSVQKSETVLQTIAYFTEHGTEWQSLSDAEVRVQLGQIKGIGAWTMDMILMYTLQRTDVFPLDDFHLKEIMVKLYKLNPDVKLKAQMRDVATAWATHKSLAVKYLLAWKTLSKKGEI